MTLATTKAIYLNSIKNTAAYRANMLFSLITGPLFLTAQYIIWKAIYTGTGMMSIRGYTFQEMITYIVLSTITTYIIYDDIAPAISEHVRTGEMTTYMLKPINYFNYLFIDKLGHRTVALFIEYIPVIIITGIMFGFDVYKTSTLPLYIIMTAYAFIIGTILSFIVGLTGFWLIRPRGVFWLYWNIAKLASGLFIPLTLYPAIVQKILIIMPFQFFYYWPTQSYIGEYTLATITFTPITLIAYATIHTIILSIIATILWKRAIKRFTGAGI